MAYTREHLDEAMADLRSAAVALHGAYLQSVVDRGVTSLHGMDPDLASGMGLLIGTAARAVEAYGLEPVSLGTPALDAVGIAIVRVDP